MKIKGYLHLLLALMAIVTCMTSCKETDDTVEEYPDWQKKNEAFFNAKYNAVRQYIANGDTSWKIIKSYALQNSTIDQPTNYILVKVLREGTGSGCPLYTDTVRVHYRGQLLASTTHVDSKDSELGYVFEKSWATDTFDESISIPSKMGVANLTDGFSTAIQHMHIGDRWLVYIPHQLAYGSQDKTVIPAYSTLVFDLTLAAYYRPGRLVPNWSANQFVFNEEE